jgi:hypothetical protein
LVATMVALVLGLLVASAKGSYDAQSTELTDMSSRIVVLDRVLAHYGPETKEVRDMLRSSVVQILDQVWSKNGTAASPQSANAEPLFDKIQGLSPQNDSQRSFKAQALSIGMSVGQTRWLSLQMSGTRANQSYQT